MKMFKIKSEDYEQHQQKATQKKVLDLIKMYYRRTPRQIAEELNLLRSEVMTILLELQKNLVVTKKGSAWYLTK